MTTTLNSLEVNPKLDLNAFKKPAQQADSRMAETITSLWQN